MAYKPFVGLRSYIEIQVCVIRCALMQQQLILILSFAFIRNCKVEKKLWNTSSHIATYVLKLQIMPF